MQKMQEQFSAAMTTVFAYLSAIRHTHFMNSLTGDSERFVESSAATNQVLSKQVELVCR